MSNLLLLMYHTHRIKVEKSCVTFLLCDPGWCVHKSDVQSKWDDNTHSSYSRHTTPFLQTGAEACRQPVAPVARPSTCATIYQEEKEPASGDGKEGTRWGV